MNSAPAKFLCLIRAENPESIKDFLQLPLCLALLKLLIYLIDLIYPGYSQRGNFNNKFLNVSLNRHLKISAI